MSKLLKYVQGVVKRNWPIPSAIQEPRSSQPTPIPPLNVLNPVQPAAGTLSSSEYQACTSSSGKAPPAVLGKLWTFYRNLV